MLSRRKLLLAVTTCVVAMGFVASVIADELLGVMTKVDVDGKKITVLTKDGDDEKEVVITVTDDTEVKTKGGNAKVDLEKLEKGVKKAQDAGKKGVSVKITHEKKVASLIEYTRKKGGKKKAD